MFLLTHAVDRSADRYPEREAVRFEGESLTYGELSTRTDRLAGVLRDQGVRRGDRVGIYMHKSLESAVAIYGIMKAGAAYVPLDPSAPLGRIGFVIRDCGIRHLVSNDGKRGTLEELSGGETGLGCIVGLSDGSGLTPRSLSWQQVYSSGLTSAPQGAVEQDLAYILYTSGSTGTPKGIMHTHRSALSFAEWGRTTYGLTHEDRLSNHAPLHFDLSTFDFFGGALAGAATVIIPEEYTKLPASLSQLMAEERLSVWYSVPSALMQLQARGGLAKRDLRALRWVLFAGEVFPTKHLRQLMREIPHARFSNLYGPTETNVCTYYHVPVIPPDADDPIPIGRPCENVDAMVVDENDQAVPPGSPGELLIRGGVVMQGYWGRPDLNERAFHLKAVFPSYVHVYHRTGDLVQGRPDGNFEFLGRKDRQIKSRGYRVELDEIEIALLAHEGVAEAAVFPVPDEDGGTLIQAAVITKEFNDPEPAELISHLAARLPWYALPVRIDLTDGFPRTSTGKIDRRALQAHAIASKSESGTGTRSTTETRHERNG